MKLNDRQKAMIASYARSLVATGLAAYSASGGDLKDTLNALWASLLPVILRWANKNDPSFGRGSDQ